MTSKDDNPEGEHSDARTSKRTISGLSQLPAPIKCIFDKFPLKTYSANDLPQRAPQIQGTNVLHVFNTKDGASRNAPSFNPTCLKWQAYLKFCGIHFQTSCANNHSSPTGVLPYLTPASSSTRAPSPQPISSNKLLKWVTSQTSGIQTNSGMRYDAYTSLIDHRIRQAWLFTLYLDEKNSEVVAKQLYIYPTSSNFFVQMTLYHQLKQAARDELLKTSLYIREGELYTGAENAFEALSTLLGDDVHFFGKERPSLFDARVFAYTHLLLDETLNWQNRMLADSLRTKENLVRHRERLLTSYFDCHDDGSKPSL